MVEKSIVPTIFAKNIDVFSNKLKLLTFAPIIHVDFMDGQFTNKGRSISIDTMKDLISVEDERKIQIHLMAYRPEKYIKNLLKIRQIYRVYMQYEAFDDATHVNMSANEFKSRNYEVFMVLNPATDESVIDDIVEHIDGVMLMGVNPGAEGQTFIENSLDKAKKIKQKYPKLEVAIDGGLNSQTIAKVILAGVDTFCVGSYISSSDTPKENYENLKVLINK